MKEAVPAIAFRSSYGIPVALSAVSFRTIDVKPEAEMRDISDRYDAEIKAIANEVAENLLGIVRCRL